MKNKNKFIKTNKKKKLKAFIGAEIIKELGIKTLYEYLMELLNLHLSFEVYKLNIHQKNIPYFVDILENNIKKINMIKSNKISSLLLNARKTPLSDLKKIKHSIVFPQIIYHSQNLLLLGKEYFSELIYNVNLNKIPKDYFSKISKYLFITKKYQYELINNIDKYWYIILRQNLNIVNEILSNIIILNFVPVPGVLTYLDIPHKDFFINKDFTFENYDLNKLEMNNVYGKFSEVCDIRLICFYLNYLKNVYQLNKPIKQRINKVNYYLLWIYYYKEGENNLHLLHNKMSLLELEVLNLCDGNNTISNIYNILMENNHNICENTLKDIFISFYQRHIIF